MTSDKMRQAMQAFLNADVEYRKALAAEQKAAKAMNAAVKRALRAKRAFVAAQSALNAKAQARARSGNF